MDESFREKFSSGKLTSKKTLSVMAFMVLALGISAPGVIAQDSGGGTESVSLGQNGVTVNLGDLSMEGNDIESNGNTIFDGSAGNIPSAIVDKSGFTASDVGLGNVENENALAQDGSEQMTGDLDIASNDLVFADGDISSNDLGEELIISSTERMTIQGDSDGSSGGPYNCYINEGASGDFECDGAKSWIHSLNSTHEAKYTSQESPEVRAVYEGQVDVSDGRVNVSLPYHFSGTVSDERPSLRVQATPHSLANVAVTERTDDYLIIEADTSETVEVDYRVTGIREGYEDNQVVRPKEE